MVQEIVNNIPKDKLLHFVAGMLICTSCSWVLGYWALVVVVVFGIGKEVYDKYFGGTADKWDAVATGLGGLLAIM